MSEELKKEMTDEFLATLTKAARTAGWGLDHICTVEFVEWCHDLAEKPRPQDMEPFPDPD